MASSNPHSTVVTEGIRVHAAAQYLPGESDPDGNYFFYIYRITITNDGDRWVRLLSRHWIIIDANRVRDDVRGPGVVGQFPELAPGQSFSYVSSCPLRTRWGTMEGAFTFEDGEGDRFQADVGRFFLVPSAPPIEAPVS